MTITQSPDRDALYLEITGEDWEEIPKWGGSLSFSDNGIASCHACGWRGVPNLVGGLATSTPVNPSRTPYRREGSVVSTECPACEQGDTVGEFLKGIGPRQGDITMVAQSDRKYAPANQRVRVGEKIGRNDPCDCGSGRKAKKCCHR